MSCSGENCNSVHIQNKKYNLCSDCVFKKSHGGKSKAEVYKERSLSKVKSLKPTTYTPSTYNIIGGDEEGLKNAIAQDIAEQREREEQGVFGKLPPWKNEERESKPKKKQKSVKKITEKQSEINRLYKLTCIDMDYTTEPVCTGCLKYQGGDIKLSHSHIISREDCKRIGRIDLISDRNNLTYHCMSFGENDPGCHRIWENPKDRNLLNDYEKNMEYIKSISEELYQKYTNK